MTEQSRFQPFPEPWRTPSKRRFSYPRRRNRVPVNDAKGRMVAFCDVRTPEKVWKKPSDRLTGARLRAQRIVTCVNACRNIPNEDLEKGVLGLAISLMEKACRFGDLQLNTLPKRIAKNMTLIFDGIYFEPKEIPDEPAEQPAQPAASETEREPARPAGSEEETGLQAEGPPRPPRVCSFDERQQADFHGQETYDRSWP